MARKTVTVNNRFTFSSTDNSVVNPENTIVSNFIDTSNNALTKLDSIVPEMEENVTDWKLATPVRLLNIANIGLSSGDVNYCVITSTKPLYVWLQDPAFPTALDPLPPYPTAISPSVADISLLATERANAADMIAAKGIGYEGVQPGQLTVGSTAAISAAVAAVSGVDDTYSQDIVNAATLTIYNARVAYNSAVVPAPYFIVHRLFVVDGGVTQLWAINPAAFNNGANDAEVKMVVAYIL